MGFFIRPSPKGFRVVKEVWQPERKTTTVPRESYHILGFRSDMTLDEAKARAQQLNRQAELEAERIAGAAKRVLEAKEVDSVYLPAKMVGLFVQELELVYEDNPNRLATVLKHWDAAKELIKECKVDPKDFYAERVRLFSYEKKQRWSTYYIKTIRRMLNLWGAFCSRKNGYYFQPLPKLTNNQAQTVTDLRDADEELYVRRPAVPLTYEALKASKVAFEEAGLIHKWNWMFIGLWFGLRPIEIDNLVKGETNWMVVKDPVNKIEVLSVFQTKLTSLPKDKRWKEIPVFLPEQKEALKLIRSGLFERPLNKTLALHLGAGIETYSPRKGFTDLMLARGFALEDISQFLGHHSIEMTWRHYKNKKRYNLPKAG